METGTTAAVRRSVVRRAVHLSCGVRSELWDGLAPFVATDLSQDGLRLCSPFALTEGQELVVTFTPPRWPDSAGPINALARVTHVALPRRHDDLRHGAPAGMGLSFLHVDPTSRALLALTLRGLPPPLPKAAIERAPAARVVRVGSDLEQVLEHDGLELTFRAEAPLLTAYRPLVIAPARSLPTQCTVTSAITLRRKFRSYRYRSGSERGTPSRMRPSRALELVS